MDKVVRSFFAVITAMVLQEHPPKDAEHGDIIEHVSENAFDIIRSTDPDGKISQLPDESLAEIIVSELKPSSISQLIMEAREDVLQYLKEADMV